MIKDKINRFTALILFFFLFISITISVCVFADEAIPAPIKVVDFSKSFEELATEDAEFEVVDNAAKPQLVKDEEMGQVLQLGKAVIKNQTFFTYPDVEEPELAQTDYIISDDSEYSTINISNPFAGVGHLVEYEPYEDVETTSYYYGDQPFWKEGITISYWIKTPSGEDGYGINSNVLGFTSERFQVQADDYAKYQTTVKFDMEYNSLTDEERAAYGEAVEKCGVLPGSDFFFMEAYGEVYENLPVYYYDPSNEWMGKTYWMNKFFVEGYINVDGEMVKAGDGAYYADWCEYPTLGDSEEIHDPGTSNLRYGWTYSEMWLDASSSFFFTNDENINTQLNPNCSNYGKTMGMQSRDCFNINSWRCFNGVFMSYAESDKSGLAAESPVINPDEWHYVTAVIQNDWVDYYLDGNKINVKNDYSAYATEFNSIDLARQVWRKFNKGTGSRYGYGVRRPNITWSYYGNYCAPTIMEWITMDCVNLTIGGGNRNGDAYCMYADTDEIYLKNIVFYDTMLTDEQIAYLATNPTYYEDYKVEQITVTGDVNQDGKISARDALMILKHAASIELLETPELYDLSGDGRTNSEDALIVLKISAGLI